MPAVLAEVACLSNNREARLLAQPSYRQKIAEALFEGIEYYSRHVNPPITIAEKGTQHD
jgi:N-acetylmuramoyl-L-alanine amidase